VIKATTIDKIERYVYLLRLPIVFLLLFLSLVILWSLLNLPDEQVLSSIVEGYFTTYGLPVVFFAAFLEGLMLVGNYFPGAFIIVLGIALAPNMVGALLVLGVGVLALMFSHSVNYALGRYGWYHVIEKYSSGESVKKSKNKLLENEKLAIFSSYWLPSLAAVIDTAAGVVKLPFRRFITISTLSSIFWNSIAAAVTYTLGDKAIELVSPSGSTGIVFIFCVVIVWSTVIIVKDLRMKQ